VYLIDHRDAVDAIGFDLLDAAPRLLLQHFIPGGDGNVHFCLLYTDRDGRELDYYTGRKVLQWPHLTGSTAIGIGTVNERVHELSREILAQTGHRGLGSVEFKRSDADGEYYVTEPTVGRNNYQSYLAVAGGVNLTRIAYYDAIGMRPPAPSSKRRLSVWIDQDYSSRAVGKQERRMLLTFGNLGKALQRRIVLSDLSLADPMPFILFWIDWLPPRLRSVVRRVALRLRPASVRRRLNADA
jgi:predicted ATP-grasp superfamily ATP-dependent carboligase